MPRSMKNAVGGRYCLCVSFIYTLVLSEIVAGGLS
jgi:hypothetical protein